MYYIIIQGQPQSCSCPWIITQYGINTQGCHSTAHCSVLWIRAHSAGFLFVQSHKTCLRNIWIVPKILNINLFQRNSDGISVRILEEVWSKYRSNCYSKINSNFSFWLWRALRIIYNGEIDMGIIKISQVPLARIVTRIGLWWPKIPLNWLIPRCYQWPVFITVQWGISIYASNWYNFVKHFPEF